jgi:hypothetical protein
MKNDGSLKLVLPELPDDWHWNTELRENDYGIGVELELILKVERGVYRSTVDGALGPNEVLHSMPIAIERHKDYDELIVSVQQEVDNMVERINDWDSKELSRDDALKHIVDTVNTSRDVTKALHSYDDQNV